MVKSTQRSIRRSRRAADRAFDWPCLLATPAQAKCMLIIHMYVQLCMSMASHGCTQDMCSVSFSRFWSTIVFICNIQCVHVHKCNYYVATSSYKPFICFECVDLIKVS